MVRKAIDIITGKISSLHAAAFWLASFSFLSQILAFLRDRILAYHFGAGRELDLYYASFEVPDLIFNTAASLVSASILIPLLARWDHEQDKDKEKHINSVFTAFFVLLILSCGLAWIFMPHLVELFFSGLGKEGIIRVSGFARILILSPFFLGLSNFFGSITQYEKRFLLYSASPLLYNLGIILGALTGASRFGIIAVVIGVASGAFMHMLIQAVWLFFSKKQPKLTLNIDWREILSTFALSVPRTISLSASSLVGLVFIAIASKFPEGSIAAYTFSFNLQSVPLVVIGASYSLAAFPTLAGHFAKKEMNELSECLTSGLRHIIFWALPTTALFIVLRAHIVRTVLGSGQFDWSDTKITAAALSVFVVSMVFQSIQLFLTRAHYAFGRTKLPLIINLFSASLTVFIAILLSRLSPSGSFFTGLSSFLKIEGFQRLIVLSLPVAFSIGSAISAILLWRFLESEIRAGVFSSVGKASIDALLASLCAGIASWVSLRLFDGIFDLNSALGVFMHGFVSGIMGIASALMFLYFIGNRELSELIKRKRRRVI